MLSCLHLPEVINLWEGSLELGENCSRHELYWPSYFRFVYSNIIDLRNNSQRKATVTFFLATNDGKASDFTADQT